MRWTGNFLAAGLICAVFSPLSRASMAPQNKPKIGAEGLPGAAAQAAGLNVSMPPALNSIPVTPSIPPLADISNSALNAAKQVPAVPNSSHEPASAVEAVLTPDRPYPLTGAKTPAASPFKNTTALLRGLGGEIARAPSGGEDVPLAHAMDGTKAQADSAPEVLTTGFWSRLRPSSLRRGRKKSAPARPLPVLAMAGCGLFAAAMSSLLMTVLGIAAAMDPTTGLSTVRFLADLVTFGAAIIVALSSFPRLARGGWRFTLSGLFKFTVLIAASLSALNGMSAASRAQRNEDHWAKVNSDLGDLQSDASQRVSLHHFIAFFCDLQRLHTRIQGRGEAGLIPMDLAQRRKDSNYRAAMEYYYPAVDMIESRLGAQEGPWPEAQVQALYKEYSRSYGSEYLGKYVTAYPEFKSLADIYRYYLEVARNPNIGNEKGEKIYLGYLDYVHDKQPKAKGIDPESWKEKTLSDFKDPYSSGDRTTIFPHLAQSWIHMSAAFFLFILLQIAQETPPERSASRNPRE